MPSAVPRRKFIALFGGAAFTHSLRPLAARSQQSAMPVIGFLHASSAAGAEKQVMGYREGLKESGYIEGQNIAIEFRWAEGHYDRLPALAADLVQRQVAVLVAGGGNAPALAAKASSATIPIVFVSGSDPVRAHIVDGLNRPGVNITGFSMILSALMAKSLDLVHQLVPNAEVIGALVNPDYSDADMQVRELQEAAMAIKRPIHIVNASTESAIDAAFASLAELRAAVLLVANDPFFTSRRNQLVALAARYKLPAIYSSRDYVVSGGPMSYAPSLAEAYRQAAEYTVRILKGANPSDLPVMQPTKFELVINLKTAKALGLEIPPKVLALADEVVE